MKNDLHIIFLVIQYIIHKKWAKRKKGNAVAEIKQNLNFLHKYNIIQHTAFLASYFFFKFWQSMFKCVFFFWLAIIWKYLVLFCFHEKYFFSLHMALLSLKLVIFTSVLWYLYNLCDEVSSLWKPFMKFVNCSL